MRNIKNNAHPQKPSEKEHGECLKLSILEDLAVTWQTSYPALHSSWCLLQSDKYLICLWRVAPQYESGWTVWRPCIRSVCLRYYLSGMSWKLHRSLLVCVA